MYAQTLLAAAVAAMPLMAAATPTPVYHSMKKRADGARHGPMVLANRTGTAFDATGTVSTSNWGGVLASPPSGQSFSTIVGTYNVQSCSNPNDGTAGPWSVAAWIGIDGANNAASLIQAGTTCTANTDGSTSYYAWVEWLPEAEVQVDGFTVNEGDEFTISIEVTSPTTGVITLQDANSGSTTTTSLSAPTPTATIEGVSAEWIVEDASANGGFVPFASFSTYNWGGAYAVAGGNAQTAALDLDYEVVNLILDDGGSNDGNQVTFFAGDTSDSYNDAFTVANTS